MGREQDSRTEALLGSEAFRRLQASRVAVFGIGGVGGFAAEALARSGVGALDLIDKDVVAESNINRQIIALHSTIGRPKVEVMRERIAQINPDCRVKSVQMLYLPETAGQFDFSEYDCVIDAVDTVAAKVELVLQARSAGVPILCSMGAGNKLDPTRFAVADISATTVCPLARAVRRELKLRGITEGVTVVFSREPVRKPPAEFAAAEGAGAPASIAFVPSVAGLILAGEAVRMLCGIERDC